MGLVEQPESPTERVGENVQSLGRFPHDSRRVGGLCVLINLTSLTIVYIGRQVFEILQENV